MSAAVAAHEIDPAKTLTVGLATVALALAQQIEVVLGGKARARDGYVREIARIRSPEELAAARRATEIAERGYEHMLACVRPGMHEFELAAELYCFMKGLGAEDNFLLLSASQHNLAVRAAGGRILDVGVGTGISLPDYAHTNRIVGVDYSEPLAMDYEQAMAETANLQSENPTPLPPGATGQ